MSREDEEFPLNGRRTIEASRALGPDEPPIAEMVIGEAEAAVDSQGAIRAGRLAGKSLSAAIWMLALPVLLQQLMAAGVGLVDKIIAGSLPREVIVPALDAISIGSYVGWLISVAMAGLGIGGQAIIARAIGAGDLQEADRALGQSITLSVAWGTLVGVVMWATAGPLADMCQLSGEAKLYCMQYIHIIAYSMPVTGVWMVGAMCMHGAGETTLPSVIAAVVNVVNIVVSWLLSGAAIQVGDFAFSNPFGFRLHVIGIAAGTAISYALGAALTLIVLGRGVKDLRLRRGQLAVKRGMATRVARLGVPNFFEGMAMWGVNLFVLIFIGQIARGAAGNGVQEGLQGAHIIAVQWEALSFLPGFAMGTAAGALAGQYLGAGNPRMARRSVLACTAIACVIMGLLGVVFMAEGRLLTSIISREPVHVAHAPRLLFICGTIQVFFAIGMVMRQGLRGAGDALWPFVITSCSSYLVRLPAAWLLGVHLGLGLEGVWLALCGELVLRSLLFAARFLHGGWMRLDV